MSGIGAYGASRSNHQALAWHSPCRANDGIGQPFYPKRQTWQKPALPHRPLCNSLRDAQHCKTMSSEPFQDQSLHCAGLKLAIRRRTSRVSQALPLILLHDAGRTLEDWDFVMPHLA